MTKEDKKGKPWENALSGDSVMMVRLDSTERGSAMVSVLDHLVNRLGMGGVIIAVSGPYEALLSDIEGAGIDSNDLHFIDCISLTAGKLMGERSDRAVYVENPSSLEEISMYVDRMLLSVAGKRKFLILDSLSSLLIYNAERTVREFGHFIINKMRIGNNAAVLFTNEKEGTEGIIRDLSPMCDMSVRWGCIGDGLEDFGKRFSDSKGSEGSKACASTQESLKKNWGDYLNIRL